MQNRRVILVLSATSIAAVLVAMGGVAAYFIPPLRIMAAIWCCVPLLWGIWAAIIPATWLPRRVPLWGALLGVIAAIFGALWLDLPTRVLGTPFSIELRSLAIPIAAALYYLVWMGVAELNRRLAAPPPSIESSTRAAA